MASLQVFKLSCLLVLVRKMDSRRCLTKPKSPVKNDDDQGDQHVPQEKSEAKLPPSNVVPRLMGFDGMPSQQPIHRQAKSLARNPLMTSDAALQGEAHLLEGESHKKRSTEEPDSKYIFEEKFKKSGANRDSILELLKKPNPMFVKHLQGLQDSSSSSLCGHLPIPKQSNPQEYQAEHQNFEGSTSTKHDIGSKQTHDNGWLDQSSALSSTQHHPRQSKIGWEEEEGTTKGTSTFVILKPNYAMAEDACNCLSSNDYSLAHISGSWKPKRHMSDRTKDGAFLETINVTDDVEVSASRVREDKRIGKKVIGGLGETALSMKETECRESARRFNREVQEVFSRIRTEFPSYVKVIPGTGGLHDISNIDSASESDVMKMTAYDSTESYISRQAKKRLLERWRKAQSHEHARKGGKGSTLGEMLSIPEDRLQNMDAKNARQDTPLGISSADGWKDIYNEIKPRSRSLPPGSRHEKLNAEREFRTDDKLLLSKEARCWTKSQSDRLHTDFTETEKLLPKTSRSSKRKSQSRHRRASTSPASPENRINHDDKDLVKKDSPEERLMVPATPVVGSTFGAGASTTVECYTASSVSSDVCGPDVSKSMLKLCEPSRGGQEHSNPKHLGAEAESSGSSKEIDPSAISVLKVPTRGDLSLGPECFKQLITDLHDIRKQLSLLSRKPKSNFEAPMHLNTDFASEGSSLALHADEIVVSECWKSVYIADVLIEGGLYYTDTDVFMPGSKGPNHSLGPWVFHNLEMKYSALKDERMLLFDRVRSAVLEISQSCMNQCPWVKPRAAEFGLKWPECKLRNELDKLLAIQETEVREGKSGKVIDKDTYSGDLKNSIDMIGIKIERSITDDLLMDLVIELQSDV